MDNIMNQDYGLVLAGGGGKGAYQIGVYKALTEYGLDKKIVAMSGSSVGTLNMALLAMNDINMAEDVWKSISPGQFLKAQPDKIFDGKEGFISREGLLNIIDSYINRELLASEHRPMYATLSRYTDYVTNEAVSYYAKLNDLDYETVKKVMLASSALPIIYEPVKIDKYIYRDGGLTDNLPIKPLYDEGIRHFIVVMLSPNTKIPYSAFPDADFLEFRPQRDLGDLLTGTLDFTGQGALVRMQLGYYDALRYLKYRDSELLDTPGFALKLQQMEEEQYRQICNSCMVENVNTYIDNAVSNVYDYFNKYDIDL